MSKKVLEKGVTDQTFYVKLRDSGTNLGKTGLNASTSGLQAFYVRDRAAAQTVSLSALASATAAHSDGGFIEVLASMRGMYRFDSPDAPFAVGSSGVVFQLSGATGMLDCEWEVELYDPISSTNPIPAQTVSFGTQAVGSMQDRLNEYGAVRPTVSGRLAALNASSQIGVDWNNIGTQTATVALPNTTIGTATVVSTLGSAATSTVRGQADLALVGYGALRPSVSGRLLVVSVSGNAGVNWSGIENPATPNALSATTISGVASFSSSAPSVADIWSYVAGPGRTLTGVSALHGSGIWGHATRTLTSAGGSGATAQEVWEYGSRAITDKAGFSIAGTKTTLDALNDASAPTIANAVLTSGISNFESTATARSLTGAIAKLTNRVARAGTTLTIYQTNDSSTMFTQTVSASGATPIIEVDTN